KLFVFGVSPSPKVMLGRDDWLFYTGESSVEIFRGTRPFDETALEEWCRALESQRDFLARRGIAYVFAIAPNKETIYPDLVPARRPLPRLVRSERADDPRGELPPVDMGQQRHARRERDRSGETGRGRVVARRAHPRERPSARVRGGFRSDRERGRKQGAAHARV